jgi:histone acetyltransferase 1
LDIGDWISR